jgi:hypothetical protein
MLENKILFRSLEGRHHSKDLEVDGMIDLMDLKETGL